MIRLIGVVGKIFVLDLVSDMEGTISLTGGVSKDVDENICTLEELKYIETSARTKRVLMSEGDFTKLLTAIENKQYGGGTAPYPSFTGNADKVLAVKATEDGVEWKTVTGGGSGGINVIEYDPRLHEIVLSSIQNSDFIPTPASAADTRDSASWNASTGVMGVSISTGIIHSYPPAAATQQVGLRCLIDLSRYRYRGSFTIDASQCEDAWGVGLLSRSQQIRNSAGIDGLDLFNYLAQQHFKDTVSGDFDLDQPQTAGTFIELNGEYSVRTWGTDPTSENYYVGYGNSPQPTKPQGTYTFTIGTVVDAYSAFSGMTEEQVIAYFQATYSESELALISSKTLVFCAELPAFLELKADTPFLHFFMTAYHTPDGPIGTYELNPTSQLSLTFNLEEVANIPPTEAVDGDFLHLTGNANMFGKALTAGDFVQLYDNKTKMIVHANLDNVDTVGSVNGQTGAVVLDVDDVLNFPDLVSFPSLGEDGKIYIAEDVNKTYRWGGSSYVEIGGGGVALGETSSTAYRGDNGKTAYDHSQSQGNPHNTTTSDINEGSKLFFTEPRVRQTVLTGLDTSTASPALATDQLLAAIGKLQAQINNMGGVTWVSAASIGTTHPSFTNVQFAKINGLLWIRGYCNTGVFIGAGITLFLLTDPSYHLDIPPAFALPIILGEIKTFRSEGGSKLIELKNVPNNANKFSLSSSTVFSFNDHNQIQPVALGTLLTP